MTERRDDLDRELGNLDHSWTPRSKSEPHHGKTVGLYLDYLDYILKGGYTRVREPLASRFASCPSPLQDLVQMVQIGVRPSAVPWFSVGLSGPNGGPNTPLTRSNSGDPP